MCTVFCSTYHTIEVRLRPGLPSAVWRAQDVSEMVVWAGFARSERLGWWQRQGGILVDVPANRFAERSVATGILTWDDVPPGHVIRGLVVKEKTHLLLKIVTRASTEEELRHFEHPRMPVLEPPLYSSAQIEYPDSGPWQVAPAQADLF